MSNSNCCAAWAPRALSLLRIVSGYLFLLHGVFKVTGDNFQLFSLMGLAGAIEVLAGILILLGLFSRIAAFIASGEMAFAYFMAHATKGAVLMPLANGGDAAVLFCFVFLYIAVAGPGEWSLDRLFKKN